MATNPFISIVITNYNGKNFLSDCLNSLSRLNYPRESLEIIMVDNGSCDDSIELTRRDFPHVKIIKNSINNYTIANNLGIRAASGNYVALLNNDTKVDANWLLELTAVAEQDARIGAVGSRLVSPDNEIHTLGHKALPNFYWSDNTLVAAEAEKILIEQEVETISGCAALYRKSALESIRSFDEDFNMYLEDIDASIRLREKGWRLFLAPRSIVFHHKHGSASEKMARFFSERNRLILIAKHYPEKLITALLGLCGLTSHDDIDKHGLLFDVLPGVARKLIHSHPQEVYSPIIGELCAEMKKIMQFEQCKLLEQVRAMQANQAELGRILEKRSDEALRREKHLYEKNVEIVKLQHGIRSLEEHAKNLAASSSELQKHIGNLEQMLHDSQRDIVAHRQSIHDLNANIAAKDAHVNQLNQFIARKDTHIDQLNEALIGKNQHLNKLNELMVVKDGQLRAKETVINEVTSVLSERERIITQLNNELLDAKKAREESDRIIQNLNSEYKRLISINAQEKERVASLNKTVSFLRTEIEQGNFTSGQLSRERDAVQQELSGVYQSTAFRYFVKPLWCTLTLFKQCGNRFVNLFRKKNDQ